MRRLTTQAYEIYAPSAQLNAPLIIVSDKFSIFAFLFHGLWLIYHGAWRVALPWFVLYGACAGVGQAIGVPDMIIGAMQLTMQVWLGFEAGTLRALDAKLRGLTLRCVIVAHHADDAEITYYRSLNAETIAGHA